MLQPSITHLYASQSSSASLLKLFSFLQPSITFSEFLSSSSLFWEHWSPSICRMLIPLPRPSRERPRFFHPERR
uniref:Uncharacterized protein n=1 Tax=Manihot esculenta TaxID=3983 RepID=A0A2C9VUM6_MANES